MSADNRADVLARAARSLREEQDAALAAAADPTWTRILADVRRARGRRRWMVALAFHLGIGLAGVGVWAIGGRITASKVRKASPAAAPAPVKTAFARRPPVAPAQPDEGIAPEVPAAPAPESLTDPEPSVAPRPARAAHARAAEAPPPAEPPSPATPSTPAAPRHARARRGRVPALPYFQRPGRRPRLSRGAPPAFRTARFRGGAGRLGSLPGAGRRAVRARGALQPRHRPRPPRPTRRGDRRASPLRRWRARRLPPGRSARADRALHLGRLNAPELARISTVRPRYTRGDPEITRGRNGFDGGLQSTGRVPRRPRPRKNGQKTKSERQRVRSRRLNSGRDHEPGSRPRPRQVAI